MALLGIGLSVLAGLMGTQTRRCREADEHQDSLKEEFRLPLQLAHRSELFQAYRGLVAAITDLTGQKDGILQEAALVKLASLRDQLASLARGQLVFSATQAWRVAYEQILTSPGIHCYRSVAWLQNEDYWQDEPGRQSMQLNYDLLSRGVLIERMLILSDFFWPPKALMPSEDVARWINQQHERGIAIALVRESALEAEPDLLCDFGIYGDRATGTLQLDGQGRMVRFTLDFSPESLRLAVDRWQRLGLFTISYSHLLDREAQGY